MAMNSYYLTARLVIVLPLVFLAYARFDAGPRAQAALAAVVLALGATLVTVEEALQIVDTFVDTPMREARYIRRLAKIRDLEDGRG